MTKIRNDRRVDIFYEALKKAGSKLGKSYIVKKTYNTLVDNGLISLILNGSINLDNYDIEELQIFRGVGPETANLIQVAWFIFNSNNTSEQLSIPESKLNGYLIGEDLIKLIRKHHLADKKIEFDVANPEDSNIGFLIKTVDLDSEDPNDRYFELHQINLQTGELKIIKDYVD